MKKYKFSMQKVLNFKGVIQDNETNILREMKQRHNELLGQEKALISKYEDCKKDYAIKSAEGMSINEVTDKKMYIKVLQEKIEQKKMQIAKSEIEIDKQLIKLTKVKTEKASIEKLKEKDFANYKVLEQKETEVFVEEFVANSNIKDNP